MAALITGRAFLSLVIFGPRRRMNALLAMMVRTPPATSRMPAMMKFSMLGSTSPMNLKGIRIQAMVKAPAMVRGSLGPSL